jgi:hypothetical protein
MGVLFRILGFLGFPPRRGLVQLTYQFADFYWPGYSLSQWKAGARAAGDYWESQAAVRFKEVPDAKYPRFTFRIVTRNRPGVWGLWSPPDLIVSTWPPNLREWSKLTPERKDHFARSLIWQEEFHVLGGPQKVHLQGPQAMIAWARARYGPPPRVAEGPLPSWLQDEEVQSLLSRPAAPSHGDCGGPEDNRIMVSLVKAICDILKGSRDDGPGN